MPSYDYRCSKCRKNFTLVVSISEHESKRARCPRCHSLKVARVLSGFYAKTVRKS